MHCTSCSISIDGDLEDADGVKEAKTHYAKAQTEVTFDPQMITEEEIVGIIRRTGYTAKNSI